MLNESEEQSLWLFMKWVAIDGVFLFGLPSMRIPWMEWSSTTMLMLFMVHAFADAMLMFQLLGVIAVLSVSLCPNDLCNEVKGVRELTRQIVAAIRV